MLIYYSDTGYHWIFVTENWNVAKMYKKHPLGLSTGLRGRYYHVAENGDATQDIWNAASRTSFFNGQLHIHEYISPRKE